MGESKNTAANDEKRMEKIVALCKRRGIIFPSSGIYGGVNGCWDYGPVGVELKNNIKSHWWRANVTMRDDVVGMDSSIITHPEVWRASGHVDQFHDQMVDCKECKHRFRLDLLEGDRCPDCGGELTEPRAFNLMFKTQLGATADSQVDVYLRPETCQSLFVDFKEVLSVSRVKIPFGIAQVGKSFRNEVTPRNFIFRSREFEQMEIEYFVREQDAPAHFDRWLEERQQWLRDIGIRPENIRVKAHEHKELAHYAKAAADIQYKFPFGWGELEGVHNRGDFDLTQHAKFSGKDLSYFDPATKTKYVPFVVETSAGVDRTLLAVLCDAYAEEEEREVLRLSPAIAPVKVGVYPLVNKGGLPEIAQDIYQKLRGRMATFYDTGGSIGKRYRRQDEIGTPFGVTVDFDTLEDETVTLRERDSMEQRRVKIDELPSALEEACS